MSLRQLLLASLVSVVVGTVLFPFEYMGPDQPEHLTLINRALDANYLRNDWAINTHQVDSVRAGYASLVAAVTRLVGSVPAHYVVWYVTLAIDGAAIAAWIVASGTGVSSINLALAAGLGTIYSFVFWFATTSFLSSTPAPATLAQALCLASWTCLLWRRGTAAVVLGVLASLLHVQIGPSAMLIGALASMIRDRRVSASTAIMSAAGMGFFGQGYLALGGDFAESQRATVLLAEVRAPWHHMPQTWPIAQYLYLAQALIATTWLVTRRQFAGSRFLIGLVVSLALWSILGLIWMAIPDLLFLEKLSALRMWVMLAPIAGAALALMTIDLARRLEWPWVSIIVAIMMSVVAAAGSKLRQLSLAVAFLASVALVDALPLARRRMATTTIAFAVIAVLSWGCVMVAREWPATVSAGDAAEEASRHDRLALAECVRRSTPTDAVFLVPPQLPDWRLDLERAIYVDFKMFPVRSGDTLEWYRRMNTIVRQSTPAPFVRELPDLYRRLNADDVSALATAERLDFFISDRDYPAFTLVCSAGQWRAFQLPR